MHTYSGARAAAAPQPYPPRCISSQIVPASASCSALHPNAAPHTTIPASAAGGIFFLFIVKTSILW